MFKTILLNENVSVGFKFILESFSEHIAQFLGGYSRPILSGILLGIVVAPSAIVFLAHFSTVVFVGLGSPSECHPGDAYNTRSLAKVESQNIITIAVFNSKVFRISAVYLHARQRQTDAFNCSLSVPDTVFLHTSPSFRKILGNLMFKI
ncbi:MAG: hypothetical protein IKS90_00620 [Clostridia bacterium]|nr:hypothetical protein [Clostridia bacterium]